jgi:hypothetical protein
MGTTPPAPGWPRGSSAAFLERLAALVPRPRAHLLTYHGVLAPAAQWRDQIVPRAQAESHDEGAGPACSHDSRAAQAQRAPTRTRRSTWAELLRRVFAIDVLTCPDCGGARRLIATITDGLVVQRILGHLELPSSPPPMAPARAPPEPEFAW